MRKKYNTKKILKSYKKYHREAAIRLEKLEKEFKNEFFNFEIEIIYTKLMSFLQVKEKNINFTGAKFAPITLMIAIAATLATSTFLSPSEPDSIINQAGELISIIITSHGPIIQKILFIILSFLIYCLLFTIPLGFIIIAILIYDRSFRRYAIINNLMIELLQEKISELKTQT